MSTPGSLLNGRSTSFTAVWQIRGSSIPDVFQLLSDHHLGRDLCKRDAGRLADKRHRPARPRVCLEDKDRLALDRHLEVDKPDHPDSERDPLRVVPHLFDHRRGERLGGDHAGRVSGVDPGLLDMLHDPADQNLLAVADRIDVEFDRVLEERIDQHRVVPAHPDRLFHVRLELDLIVDDLHRPSAKHVGRADKDRVPDCSRLRSCLLNGVGGTVRRARDIELPEQLGEPVPVLGLYATREAPVGRDVAQFDWKSRLRQNGTVHRIAQRLGRSTRRRGALFNHHYSGNGYHYEADEVRNCVERGQNESTIMPLDDSVAVASTSDTIRCADRAAARRAAMKIAFVGCGYVFDIYMRTRWAHPELEVCGVYDIDTARSAVVSRHYGLKVYPSLQTLLADPSVDIVVNLTSIRSHYDVVRQALEAGKHVYSEKPLTTDLELSGQLFELAAQRDGILTAAPCNIYSDAVGTMWKAVRDGAIGKPVLVYAELDDNPAHLMHLESVQSPTGAPFPFAEELQEGTPSSTSPITLSGCARCSSPVVSLTAFSKALVAKKTDTPLFATRHA